MSKTAAERQREKRKRDTDVTKNVTCHETDVTADHERTAPVSLGDIRLLADSACLEHYLANQDKYIKRSEPDKLNWGPWMSSDELSKAGLKANRVTIPGDWDYA